MHNQVAESGKYILELANEEMGLVKIDTTYPYHIEKVRVRNTHQTRSLLLTCTCSLLLVS